ncbi:MAG TPA: hypothetical protein VKJ65_11550 [Phycisphaerae bacterium]|nr:hypothetical protein [Phycisphaerae bacterium]
MPSILILAFSPQTWDIITGLALAAVVIMWFLARFWARSTTNSNNDEIDTPNIDRANRKALEKMVSPELPEVSDEEQPVPDDLLKVVENKQSTSRNPDEHSS